MRTLEEWRDRNPDSIEPRLEIAYLLERKNATTTLLSALKRLLKWLRTTIAPTIRWALSERAGILTRGRTHKQPPRSLELQRRACAANARSPIRRKRTRARNRLALDSVQRSRIGACRRNVPPRKRRVQSRPPRKQNQNRSPNSFSSLTMPAACRNAVSRRTSSIGVQLLGFGEVVVLSRLTPFANLFRTYLPPTPRRNAPTLRGSSKAPALRVRPATTQTSNGYRQRPHKRVISRKQAQTYRKELRRARLLLRKSKRAKRRRRRLRNRALERRTPLPNRSKRRQTTSPSPRKDGRKWAPASRI